MRALASRCMASASRRRPAFVVLCLHSMGESQVWFSADGFYFPQGWMYLRPSSEHHGVPHIVFVGGRKALRQ